MTVPPEVAAHPKVAALWKKKSKSLKEVVSDLKRGSCGCMEQPECRTEHWFEEFSVIIFWDLTEFFLKLWLINYVCLAAESNDILWGDQLYCDSTNRLRVFLFIPSVLFMRAVGNIHNSCVKRPLCLKRLLLYNSLYEMRPRGIMVVEFIILDWRFVLIPCRHFSQRVLAIVSCQPWIV